jgi:hypothetical protein
MRLKLFLGPLLAWGLCLGCSSTVPPVGLAYAPVTPGVTMSTINGGTPATAPPPSVSALDMAVARAAHRTLRSDKALASAASRVSVRSRKGIVTLSGTVPTLEDRNAIVARIASLPAVDEIQDQLAVAR